MPSQTSKKKRNRKGALNIIPSSDLLANVTIPADSTAGRVIAQLDLNPRKFPETNWYLESLRYSNWRPMQLIAEIVPSASSTTSGTYKYGWTNDSSLDLIDGVNAIRTISSFEVQGTRKIYESVRINIPCETVQRLLFCDGERGESDQGTLYLALNSAIGNLTTTTGVTFSINLYANCLWKNRMALPGITPFIIYPDEGYENYFTDSSSNVGGGAFLTMKATEGGNPVPFSSSKARAVYKFQGTKLAYCLTGQTSATATGIVTHASPVWNTTGSPMYVFKNETDALAYAKTGNTATCLPYIAAGPYVSPTGAGWLLTTNPPPVLTTRDF